MFCPGCGKQISTGLNFCNVCGINLHAVQQVITSSSSAPLTGQQLQVYNQSFALEKARHGLKKAGLLLMGSGMFVSMALAIIGDALHSYLINRLSPLGVLFMLLGIMILIYRRAMYGKANSTVVVIEQNQMSAPQQTALPPAQAQNNFDSPVPPGRPLFQGITQTGLQQPISMGENPNPSYPYPPPPITEHTTKELKPPKTRHNPY